VIQLGIGQDIPSVNHSHTNESKTATSQAQGNHDGAKSTRNNESSESLEKERARNSAMESQLQEMKRRCTEQAEQLTRQNNDIRRMQEKQESDLRGDLQQLSLECTKSRDMLEKEKKESDKLAAECNQLEKLLKTERKKNVLISNQLEEMARGYSTADGIIDDEKQSLRMSVHRVTSVLRTLREELQKERLLSANIRDRLPSKIKDLYSAETIASLTMKINELERDNRANSSLQNEYRKVKEEHENMAAELKMSKTLRPFFEFEEKEDSLQKKKEAELRTYLRLMSLNYVENAEQLKRETKRVKVLTVERNDLEQKLTNELKRNTLIYNQLEKMARGYVHVDTIIDFERYSVKESTNALASVFDVLEAEVIREYPQLISMKDALAKGHNPFKRDWNKTEFETIQALKKTVGELEKTIANQNKTIDQIKTDRDKFAVMLKAKTSETSFLQSALSDGRKQDRSKEQDKKIATLTDDLTLLQNKYKCVYNDLVDIQTEILLKPNEETSKDNVAPPEMSQDRIIDVEEDSEIKALQYKLSEKENECDKLYVALERHERRIKVAKKMIQAEKNRHRAMTKEIDAKNAVIDRIEKQASRHLDELQGAKEMLAQEKEGNVAAFEIFQTLDSEKPAVTPDTLRSTTTGENSSEGLDDSAVSAALKAQFQSAELVRQLQEDNLRLRQLIGDKVGSGGEWRELDSLDGTSLSDFSFAQMPSFLSSSRPASRQVNREITIPETSMNESGEEDEALF